MEKEPHPPEEELSPSLPEEEEKEKEEAEGALMRGGRVAAAPPGGLSPGFALFLVTVSALGFSLQALVVKTITLESRVPAMEIVLFRGASQLLGCWCVLAFHEPMRRSPVRWLGDSVTEAKWLALRGLIGFFGIMFGFQAVTMIGLAESQVVATVTPVFSACYARVFLGEPWLALERVAAAVALSGVLVQFEGDATAALDDGGATTTTNGEVAARRRLHALGLACSLASAASAGGAHVLVRMLGTRIKVDWPILMEYQGLGQVILSGAALHALDETFVALPAVAREPRIAALIALCGLCGFLSQIAMTRGMQAVKSASASLMRLSGLPWAFLFQALATPDKITPRSLVGAVIIASAMLVIVYSNNRGKKQAGTDNKTTESSGGAPPRDAYAPVNALDDSVGTGLGLVRSLSSSSSDGGGGGGDAPVPTATADDDVVMDSPFHPGHSASPAALEDGTRSRTSRRMNADVSVVDGDERKEGRASLLRLGTARPTVRPSAFDPGP